MAVAAASDDANLPALVAFALRAEVLCDRGVAPAGTFGAGITIEAYAAAVEDRGSEMAAGPGDVGGETGGGAADIALVAGAGIGAGAALDLNAPSSGQDASPT